MIHTKDSPRAQRAFIAFFLGLTLFVAPKSQSETIREFQTSQAQVRLTLLPSAAIPVLPGDTLAPPIPQAPESAILDSISDFTALAQLVREGDALMEVYFLNHGIPEELRFPLKYSELRRHLLLHPMDYQQETVDARNVALFGDLAGALRVLMMDPVDMKEKP